MPTLIPVKIKLGLMKVNSAIARLTLYGDVADFAFARWTLMERRRCHPPKLIFASHVLSSTNFSDVLVAMDDCIYHEGIVTRP